MKLKRPFAPLLPILVGVISLGITLWLWTHERQTEEANLRASFDFGLRQASSRIEQRMAGYAIRSPGARAEFAPATYIAPAIGNRLKGLGYDPLSDPVRRNAMLRARDSGGIAITDKIRMIGDSGPGPRSGFLMFLPLYERGQTVDTVAARRAHLVGWVWAAFRLADIMSSLYGEGAPGLDLRIYDGVEVNADTLMYRSAAVQAEPGPARFEAQEYVGFSGHTWTLQ